MLKLTRLTLVSSLLPMLSGTADLNPHELGCKWFLLRTLPFVAPLIALLCYGVSWERGHTFNQHPLIYLKTRQPEGAMFCKHPCYIIPSEHNLSLKS